MPTIVPIAPFDYETCCSAIDGLRHKYPFLTCRVIGRSHVGRAIFALSVGQAQGPVLLAAGFHGTEWITTIVLLRFLERVCESLQSRAELCHIQIAGALEGRALLAVPCVNPDGIQIALHGAEAAGVYRAFVSRLSGDMCGNWNANARGVDINHNFGAGWQTLRQLEQEAGITGPAPGRYGGPSPESEPETKALTRLTRLRQPRHVLAIHSQGEEIFWQYGGHVPEGTEKLARIFAAASGYELVKNEGLASHGGFKDWFIEKTGRPGFTVEFGKGKNPLPLEAFPDMYSKLEYLLALAAIL